MPADDPAALAEVAADLALFVRQVAELQAHAFAVLARGVECARRPGEARRAIFAAAALLNAESDALMRRWEKRSAGPGPEAVEG